MRKLVLVLVAVLAALTATVNGFADGVPKASADVSHASINGSGSSWAANAVNAWVSDVAANNLQVNFTSLGSAQGRTDFANGTTDFGVSDIGYQGVDSATNTQDTSSRPYAYLPIVAGGTSFPYQVRVAGKLVTTLRLSGATIAGIFTNQITNWNNDAITKDNNGVALPSLPIIPVVHSEGSGSTYQFTAYLAKEFPSIWTKGATEYFPRTGSQVAENGSDSVINFVTSKAGNGAIAFDEYSYALGAGYPVAKVLNAAGYYTLPSEYNVAVALTQAIINNDASNPLTYLLQDLHNVYGYTDPRTYPLSSYSYAIIPTSATDARMTAARDRRWPTSCPTRSARVRTRPARSATRPCRSSWCRPASPRSACCRRPDNKVSLANANVANCGNPTFIAGQPTVNHLAQIAPQPAACDKQGAGPCGTTAATTGSGTSTTAWQDHHRRRRHGRTVRPAGPRRGQRRRSAIRAPRGDTSVDPNTGQLVSGGGGSNAGSRGQPDDLGGVREQEPQPDHGPDRGRPAARAVDHPADRDGAIAAQGRAVAVPGRHRPASRRRRGSLLATVALLVASTSGLVLVGSSVASAADSPISR